MIKYDQINHKALREMYVTVENIFSCCFNNMLSTSSNQLPPPPNRLLPLHFDTAKYWPDFKIVCDILNPVEYFAAKWWTTPILKILNKGFKLKRKYWTSRWFSLIFERGFDILWPRNIETHLIYKSNWRRGSY